MAQGSMFNVDRWIAYSKQRQHARGNYVHALYGSTGKLFDITPKQRRRIKKNCNKNKDFSLGRAYSE